MLIRLLSAFLLAALAWSQPAPNTLTPEEEAAGWRLLFDGKTMNGWDDPSRKDPPGDSWSVEDGCIKAKSRPRIGEDLFTTETFRDFELEFDWRVAARANSGVKYRIQDRFWVAQPKPPDGPIRKFEDLANHCMKHRSAARLERGGEYVVAFEFQVIDNAVFPEGKAEVQRAGGLYDTIAPSADAARPAGEWNHSRLVVRGDHVEHWLNGVKVVDISLNSPEVRQSIEKRWTRGTPIAEALTRQPKRDCPIALQNHGDEAWFRNIKIRLQPPPLAPAGP